MANELSVAELAERRAAFIKKNLPVAPAMYTDVMIGSDPAAWEAQAQAVRQRIREELAPLLQTEADKAKQSGGFLNMPA